MSSTNTSSKLNYPQSRRGFLVTALAAPPLAAALGTSRLAAMPTMKNAQQPATAAGRLNYHPEGMYFWDSWYFTRGDEVHVIHLQKKRPGSTRPDADDGALGHAVSTDMLTWKELPVALRPGAPGSIDDNEIWTGCTYEHAGKYYLYYTARTLREKGTIQRICLATSDDTITWKKHPEPVIVPDSRWYTKHDCRDLTIHRHPQTGEFHGFYPATLNSTELVETTAIAHVRSRDLINWTHEPPVFTPQGYGVVEVPDVFYLDNRWWMILLTGHAYGSRAEFSDPNIVSGTIYASSDRLEGPYREGKDNVLIGSMQFNGFSCRTLERAGKRYLFYTQTERVDNHDGRPSTLGTITTPKELRVTADKRLIATYSPLIEQRAGGELMNNPKLSELDKIEGWKFGTGGEWKATGNKIYGASPKSWSARACGPETESFILTGDARLDRGRSIGLLFRAVRFLPETREPLAHSLAVMLDYREQSVIFTELSWMYRHDARRVNLAYGQTYRLRVIAKREFFEVYIDDALVLNFVRYDPLKGRFGVFVEAGEGMFSNLRAVSLKV